MRDSIAVPPRAERKEYPAGTLLATVRRTVAFRWVRIPHLGKKKCRYPKGYLHFLAEDEGFEPPQTESESGVLPLHKSSICDPGPHGGDNRTRTCDLMRVKHAL